MPPRRKPQDSDSVMGPRKRKQLDTSESDGDGKAISVSSGSTTTKKTATSRSSTVTNKKKSNSDEDAGYDSSISSVAASESSSDESSVPVKSASARKGKEILKTASTRRVIGRNAVDFDTSSSDDSMKRVKVVPPKKAPAKSKEPLTESKRRVIGRNAVDFDTSSSESMDSDSMESVKVVPAKKAPAKTKTKAPKEPLTKVTPKKAPTPKKSAKSSDASDEEFGLAVNPSSESSSSASSSGSESDNEESEGTTTNTAAQPHRRAAPADTEVRRKKLEESRRKREATTKAKVEKFHPELKEVWSTVDLTATHNHRETAVNPQDDQPAALKMKLLPFQLEGVGWMRRQEASVFGGGILADEMGMGKTIQAIGLLLSEPRLAPNLVLTPTVALMQWQDEILKYTAPNTLKVLIYHGSQRPTSVEELAAYDIVLSTYSIVESGYRKQQYGFKRKGQMVKEASVLHAIPWKRVVLDEAHSIKDRSCSTARAVFALKCEKKWCLSGTPLQNRVGELYSLLRFLKTDPFSYYFCQSCDCKSLSWAFTDRKNCDSCGHKPMSHFCWWNREILKPIQNYGGEHEDGRVAFRKLSHLLGKIMLRRTKVERADDLGLPPRVVVVRRDYFNEEEEDLYNSLYGDVRRKFDTYVEEDRVLNNYANIFELLMRMRQASNHPDLVTKKALIAGNQKADTLVCGICQEPAEDAIISKCKHVFCREDIQQYLEGCADPSPKCPVCFRNLNIDLSQPEIQPTDSADMDKKMRSSIINYLDMSRWRSSSKIEALVEELTNLRSRDATVKSIVFSQFVNFLDLVHWRLQRSGFTCVKLDGRMSPQQRANIIAAFSTDPRITVFLISLKAGGIALNLTEASAVFMLDPWWNPAVEDQAMDRIHRLGQHRPIKITRIIIENSIESRILQLQEKKKLLFESTVGKDMDALARLTEDDLKFLFVL